MATNKKRLIILDCDSKKVGAIHQILNGSSTHAAIVAMDDADAVHWEKVDGLVISGGPHLFTDKEKGHALRDKFVFLEALRLPVLGICLGHQAIGLRHGATVFRGPENREPVPVQIQKDHPIFEGISSGTLFGEDHCEGVTLPAGFDCLASSDDYPLEAMASKTSPYIGVQFHPEISEAPGRRLLANFITLIGKP
ncbi:MAG: C26 family cysteine hydrolase domain-containing family [Desulfobacteraceae bacterium]|nr:C26 family cysteine hydrolase domain-containing family [Desulfobacteraceae bacterium]